MRRKQRCIDLDLAEKDPHDPIQIMLAWEVSNINDAWPRFVLTPCIQVKDRRHAPSERLRPSHLSEFAPRPACAIALDLLRRPESRRHSAMLIQRHQKVIILGAGLMGRLLGLQLLRAGHPVALHDAAGPDADGAAARVAAAMLAPLAESAITEPCVVRMGQYALERWPELLAPLRHPVFFQRAGTLIVWHRQDRTEADRFEGLLRSTQRAVPGLPELQRLDADELAQHEPALAQRFRQGLLLPGEGQLDNRGLLQSLLDELEEEGAALHWQSPQTPAAFEWDEDSFVIDCRGMGSRPQWAGLRAVRGEVVRLHAPEVNLARPTRLIHPRYPIYIAPKPDHVFVVGATEIESDDNSPASVRSTLELLSAAYTVHPGFAEARILELNTQCRPTLPDNLPRVRRCGPRLVQINGLYRHGFMISPALADVAMAWITQGDTELAERLGVALDHTDPSQPCLAQTH